MPSHRSLDLTEHLPPEVLLQVFDWMLLTELARVVSVSRRWRAILVNHPTYFAHPVLDSTSPAAVTFFLARINIPARKPWDVRVTVPELFPMLETLILPAIATRLDALDALAIHVHISHADAVFELLRGSASALNRLQVFFAAGDEDHSMAILPEDILPYQGLSGGPHTLLLENVGLSQRFPPALTRVRNLVYGSKLPSSSTSLHDLACAFPVVRDVTLNNRALNDSIDSSAWPPRWNHLESLMICASRRRLRPIIAALPLTYMAHLTTLHTGNVVLSRILSHLPGPLDLSVRDINSDRFVIHLSSRTARIVRSFYELKRNWSGPGTVPHGLLSNARALGLIHSLVIPVALWNLLVPQISECSALVDITLVLTGSGSGWLSQLFSESNPPPRSVFPSLRTLTLFGERGMPVVTPRDASRIVLERLLPQSPLRLRVHGVIWTGLAHVSPVIDVVERIDGQKLYPGTPWHV